MISKHLGRSGLIAALSLSLMFLLPNIIFARHFIINLQSINGKFVTAENGGGGIVNADRDRAGEWETFTILDLNDGDLENDDRVALKAVNGNFLSAVNGGGSQLLADKNALVNWETFKIIKINGTGKIRSGDLIALKTEKGKFVVAENGGGGIVNANRDSRGEWETFKIKLAGAPPIGKLSGPFTAPQMIIPFPIGVDDLARTEGDVKYCKNNYFGQNFPNCYRGHEGTDFGLIGGFATVNLGSIDIYTVAAGKVVAVADGNPDRCYYKFPPPPANSRAEDFVYCPNDPNNAKQANFVAVLQDDGTIAYYYHMKRESVAVSVGSRVECGQFIGKVGSSGVSSVPHLHLTLQTIPLDGAFPASPDQFDQIAGNRSVATMINPYAPMLWQELIGRVPKKTCGGPNNPNGNSNPPGSCGLGQACSSQLGCQVGLLLKDGVCKRVAVPPGGNCGDNELCGPGLNCDGGKCKLKKPDINIRKP